MRRDCFYALRVVILFVFWLVQWEEPARCRRYSGGLVEYGSWVGLEDSRGFGRGGGWAVFGENGDSVR